MLALTHALDKAGRRTPATVIFGNDAMTLAIGMRASNRCGKTVMTTELNSVRYRKSCCLDWKHLPQLLTLGGVAYFRMISDFPARGRVRRREAGT